MVVSDSWLLNLLVLADRLHQFVRTLHVQSLVQIDPPTKPLFLSLASPPFSLPLPSFASYHAAMESASVSNRHPRTLQRQGLMMATTTRRRQGLAGNQNTGTTTQQLGSAQSLAERVYSWSVHELDYRPDNSDTVSKSLAMTHHNSHSKSEDTFCPQALERCSYLLIVHHVAFRLGFVRHGSLTWIFLNSLCDGPCATMFEYLVENIKPRS